LPDFAAPIAHYVGVARIATRARVVLTTAAVLALAACNAATDTGTSATPARAARANATTHHQHHVTTRHQPRAATRPGATQHVGFMPQLAKYDCPIERGPVKEGSDADRYKVSSTATVTTIGRLVHKAKPSSYPTNARIAPVELHKYALSDVVLRQYRIETDGDIHLVLHDRLGHHMIAEIPFRACTGGSRWRDAISAARSAFVSLLPVSTDWHYVHRHIDIRGIGFFDIPHGQTGVAANGIELHPVIRIHFR
jgi:hypothetical protein